MALRVFGAVVEKGFFSVFIQTVANFVFVISELSGAANEILVSASLSISVTV